MILLKTDGAAIDIDIATRIVAEDENVFIVQPGQGFHLFDYFDRSSAVFLDFPDLALDVAKPAPLWTTLREAVVRSIAIKEWIEADKLGIPPSRDVADYIGKDHGRRVGRYAGAAKALYFDLPNGTIIMAPGQRYDENVLIGELTGKPVYRTWTSLYDNERMLVRPVRWVRKKQRASFSAELRSKLGTPNPIMQLERDLRHEVISAAFDQYTFGGEYAARINTIEADFSILDDYNIQTFVNYVGGVLAALELGYTGPELTLADALRFLEDNRALTPELSQNINSPGFQRLFSSNIAPLVIAALLSMATTDGLAAKPIPPQITNSAAVKGDPCAIEVATRVEGAMKLMKLDEWRMVCERAKKAKEHTGLSTSMKVKR